MGEQNNLLREVWAWEAFLNHHGRIEPEIYKNTEALILDAIEGIKNSQQRQNELCETRQVCYQGEKDIILALYDVLSINLFQPAKEAQLKVECLGKELVKSSLKSKTLVQGLVEQYEEAIREHKAFKCAQAKEEFNWLLTDMQEDEHEHKFIDKIRQKQRRDYRCHITLYRGDIDEKRKRMQELEEIQNSQWKADQTRREKNLRSIVNKKLEAMCEAGLTENFIKEVQAELRKIERITKFKQK